VLRLPREGTLTAVHGRGRQLQLLMFGPLPTADISVACLGRQLVDNCGPHSSVTEILGPLHTDIEKGSVRCPVTSPSEISAPHAMHLAVSQYIQSHPMHRRLGPFRTGEQPPKQSLQSFNGGAEKLSSVSLCSSDGVSSGGPTTTIMDESDAVRYTCQFIEFQDSLGLAGAENAEARLAKRSIMNCSMPLRAMLVNWG
jgi:hypothetical protein